MFEAVWEPVHWECKYGDKHWEMDKYAVHVLRDGIYTGVGIFADDLDEAEKFAIDCNCAKFTRLEGELNYGTRKVER